MKRLGLVAALAIVSVLATPAPASAEPVAASSPPTLVHRSASVDSAAVDSTATYAMHKISIDSLSVPTLLQLARDSVGVAVFVDSAAAEGVTVSYRNQMPTVHRQRPSDSTSFTHATSSYRASRLLRLRR